MSHALIDGDLLTYRVAFAYQDEEAYFAVSKLDEVIHQIAQGAGCDTFELFLSGDSNFRKDIAKTVPYKGNRKEEKPEHYTVLRKFMLKQYGAVLSEDEEADDVMGYTQTKDTVICSLDKDLRMIPGWHYNFIKNEKEFINSLEAYRNFCHQLLVGDTVDNIVGLSRVGKVTASKILEDAECEEDMLCRVGLWYSIKEQNPEERLEENGKLLWIRRKPKQNWSLYGCD